MGNDSATTRASRAKASVREAIRKLTDDQRPDLAMKPPPPRPANVDIAQSACKPRQILKH